MASLIYDSFADDLVNGAIAPSADTYNVMLVTSSYTPNKATHTKRSDVTNEASGTGYTTGGMVSAVTIAKNTGASTETLTFANVTWTSSTITAAAAVIYKARGGASSADNLVAFVDFGSTVSSTAASFSVTFSSPLTFQN